MKRYMAVYSGDDFADELKRELSNGVLYLDDKPPETPYALLEIKVLKKERRYLNKAEVWRKVFEIFGLKIVIKKESLRRQDEKHQKDEAV